MIHEHLAPVLYAMSLTSTINFEYTQNTWPSIRIQTRVSIDLINQLDKGGYLPLIVKVLDNDVGIH